MSGRFDGRVVLVTGGGTGIGRAIARAFLAEGAKVAVSGRRLDPLKNVDPTAGMRLLAVQADVTSPADRKRLIETVTRELGRLDILINNAGYFVPKPLIETTDQDIDDLYRINVTGLIATTREALPHIERTKGSIINVSSVASTAVVPGTSVYASTKAAVDHFTRLLAAELGPRGVRVNTLAPGFTDTDMAAPFMTQEEMKKQMITQTPLGRVGLPEDMVPTVLFLASPEAAWVTGQVVQASGGLML